MQPITPVTTLKTTPRSAAAVRAIRVELGMATKPAPEELGVFLNARYHTTPRTAGRTIGDERLHLFESVSG